MHLLALICGISVVLCLLLGPCLGQIGCPLDCQTESCSSYGFQQPINSIAQAQAAAPTNYDCTAQAQAVAPTNYDSTAQAQAAAPTNYDCTAQAQAVAPTNYDSTAQAQAAAPTNYDCTAQAQDVAPTNYECTAQEQLSNYGYQQPSVSNGPTANAPFNDPCTNCINNCQNVATLNETLTELASTSPLYYVVLSGAPGANETDSICQTALPVNGLGLYLMFRVTVFFDGTYVVAVYLMSDTEYSGVMRWQGVVEDNIGLTCIGSSSVVNNVILFGSVSCTNCTSVPLTAAYQCHLFQNCSLPILTAPYLFVAANTPDVSSVCLDQAAALFTQAGFQPDTIYYPPHRLHRLCVTSYYGVPVINAGQVPPGDGIAFPIPQSGCTTA